MDEHSIPNKPPHDEPSSEPLRSPIRPVRPADETDVNPQLLNAEAPPIQGDGSPNLSNPQQAIKTLRSKMSTLAEEFATGKINRTQFEVLYKRFTEQRSLVEMLINREPESDSWQQVVSSKGQTTFLRSQFEAQPVYFGIFLHDEHLLMDSSPNESIHNFLGPLINKVLKTPNRPPLSLGKRALTSPHWLVLVVGQYSGTGVVYTLEPSLAQAKQVRDLHADFERANRIHLSRNWISPDRMVFPQRELIVGMR